MSITSKQNENKYILTVEFNSYEEYINALNKLQTDLNQA